MSLKPRVCRSARRCAFCSLFFSFLLSFLPLVPSSLAPSGDEGGEGTLKAGSEVVAPMLAYTWTLVESTDGISRVLAP